MRIPPNCQKEPIKSILKTSTAYPYSREDHQHHFNQKNPRSFAKDIELLLLADFERGFSDTSDDNDDETTTATITENHDDCYELTLEEQMQRYDEECYAHFDDIDDDAEVIKRRRL